MWSSFTQAEQPLEQKLLKDPMLAAQWKVL